MKTKKIVLLQFESHNRCYPNEKMNHTPYCPLPVLFRILLTLLLLWSIPGKAASQSSIPFDENKKLLIVGIDADYPPLEYVDEKGQEHGYDIEFTNILMERLGYKFTYAPNKWENIAGDVLHGRVDLAMMIYSPYRKDSTNYSRAVFRFYYQVIYRKSEEGVFSFRNLKGKHIAYMKSRPIGLMLEQEQAIGTHVPDLNIAIQELSEGKYDAVICFRYQARYFIARNNLTNLVVEDLSLPPREYCYVSPHKQLIDIINQELKKMDEEGVIDDVYGKDIKSQFGSIEIPTWVWVLLFSLFIAFLLVLVIVYSTSNKKLTAEHQKLAAAYDLLAERNEALTTAKAQAEESLRMKTAFIQQISHEIRTPLNIMNGFAQVLTNSEMELEQEEKKDISRRINENSERIANLINKMLELSEASSLAVIERSDNTTPKQIVTHAIEESGISEAKHLDFVVKPEPGVEDISLKTNLRMATRALVLLLDNAQKFTKEGTVRLLADQSADGFVSFAVEDSGIGVPAEEAEHIFDEFVQLDDYYDGTGIGLSVARSIARRLGGDIKLDTTYSPGARFIMTLPLENS